MLRQIRDQDNLAMFQSSYIPDQLFNFYVLRSKVYRNGTCLWSICVEVNGAPTRHMTIETVRGTKTQAIARLKELLSYKGVEGV